MNKQKIKELALANGFKLKQQPDGVEDLNPYVYEFATALAADAVRDFVKWGTVEMDPEFAEFKDCAEEFARLGCPSILAGKE